MDHFKVFRINQHISVERIKTYKFAVMSAFKQILTVAVIILIPLVNCSAQEIPVKTDTLSTGQVSSGKKITQKVQDRTSDVNGNQGNANGNAANKGIKQVKGARPDMTRARGARPPQIERPSGSRIPRGIGKPGGAIKPGKR